MKPLVIGVGNRWRRDDAIGPRAIEALAAEGRDDIDLLALDGEPARLVFAWADRPLVVVIDAVRTGAPPGTMHHLDALDRDLIVPPSPSTHGAGVACAVALGRALDRLPDRLMVLGIEPADIDHGDELSPAVAAVFDALVNQVSLEVASACA
jgi:hydrogenase maturation protease